tara:strand:- start:4023 stop:5030 length:1008 start_codon:yes stop_codon:yes gene_type:complete
MKTALVITTINKPNKNINSFSSNSKKKKWDLIIIGDKKSPKDFKIPYGKYLSIKDQLKLNLKFAKICPVNTYGRKNIGYLLAIRKNNIIIETDDDNFPKKSFFLNKKTNHQTRKIKNSGWINIYDFFLNKKEFIWPRGIPLDELENKIRIDKKKTSKSFLLQQGVCENNPDVDAIYRLINEKINVKFKNNKINLGKSISTFNSQNTIWFEEIFPLMYLPITCTMRCTDIWRSLVTLRILSLNNKDILFFGTTMIQYRNDHNIVKDLIDEIPMYQQNKKIYIELKKLNLKKGKKFYLKNLYLCYKKLVDIKIINKKELKYLQAWIDDCSTIIINKI